MYCERNSVRTCEECGDAGLEVTETRVDGQAVDLCPDCNQQETLGDGA